jgi:hypothetical protein
MHVILDGNQDCIGKTLANGADGLRTCCMQFLPTRKHEGLVYVECVRKSLSRKCSGGGHLVDSEIYLVISLGSAIATTLHISGHFNAYFEYACKYNEDKKQITMHRPGHGFHNQSQLE